MNTRLYTTAQVREKLGHMSRSTFSDLLHRGELVFLEEALPRIGRTARYRADLVDQYVSGRWGQRPQAFGRTA